MKSSNVEKRLGGSILAIVLLSICLIITTSALTYSMVSIEDNIFNIGTVDIDLNGGKEIISDPTLYFESGMTLKKNFYIRNDSTCDVYYKIYFQNIGGSLAGYMNVKICDGEKVLYQGMLSQLTRDSVLAADDVLAVGEKRELQIYFHLPENVGNKAQGLLLSFDIAADAVQAANNPQKNFK